MAGKQGALAPMPSLPRMDSDALSENETGVQSERAPTPPPVLQPDTSFAVVPSLSLASSSIKRRVTRSGSKKDLAAPSDEGSSSTSKAVMTPRNKPKKDSGSSVDDAGVAALLSHVATVEESIAAMRQQLLDLHTSYDSNHVAILQMIADLKPSKPINLDVVDHLEELWNMLAETRVSMQSLSSSLGTMLPREEFERRLPQAQRSQSSQMPAGFTSARAGLPSISVVPPLPHVPAPVPSPTVTRIPTPGPLSVPPSSVRLAPPSTSYLSSTVPSNLVAAPSGLSFSVSKGKRTMESDDSSSSKRTKQDVVYVELGFTPSTDNPLHIAHYVAGRLHSDFN
ncbi:hypothetical protein AAF712_014563 [Marasmius tenuissimus]|uniref:Uncharacterized protein n=1 Tax=Marasmius tenuissimus TaxID=585030 RepID=A0ABR2ZBM1_9AGAR